MRYSDQIQRLAEWDLPENQGRAALSSAGPKALVISLTTGPQFEPAVSYGIVREEFEPGGFEAKDAADGAMKFASAKLSVEIRREPFAIRITDSMGFTRFEARNLVIDGARIALSRMLLQGEGIYGLGEQGETFNRNPGRYRIWNTDQGPHHPHKQFYCGIPMAVSIPAGAEGPSALFLDNPGKVDFDIGMAHPEEMRMRTEFGDFRLWIFVEDTPAELLREYSALTGRMERPPLWAIGYQQCRYSYFPEERVREVAKTFREKRIPCDVIYFDIDYMDRYRVFTWDADRFPDPEGLLRDMAEMGYSTITIVDPGIAIAPGYFAYDAGVAEPHFFLKNHQGEYVSVRVWPGETYMPDFTHPETRTLWADWICEHLLAKGIDGIWNDMNEPAALGDSSENQFPKDAIHYDHGLFRSHDRIHNVYGLEMTRACQEALASREDRRGFALSRSGWAGIQRYAAVWTGDNASSWASMPLDIALNLGMGMSGVPFVGCDIGGFSRDATPELWARWIEWGALQPFCRAHTAKFTTDHEPWEFGAAAERITRRIVELRYQLLPYLYTLFVEATETGLPIKRPMILEFPRDPAMIPLADQFLLGPDMLIAPMLEPGKDRRLAYFPPGDWIDFWDGRRCSGAGWRVAVAPIGRPAIYFRAGAVVPMEPVRQHTKEQVSEVTYLDVWAGPVLSGRLIEDDGETLRYRNGEERRTEFSGRANDRELELQISAPAGPYQPARNRWRLRLHGLEFTPGLALANGAETSLRQEGHAWTLEFPANNESAEISVKSAD